MRLNTPLDTWRLRALGDDFLGVIVGPADHWCPDWQVKILEYEFGKRKVGAGGHRIGAFGTHLQAVDCRMCWNVPCGTVVWTAHDSV